MNLTVFESAGKVFTSCECIKGYAFKMVAPREESALLEVFKARRTFDFTALQNNCVHFDQSLDLSLLKYAS